MSLIIYLIIGGLVGWLAAKVTGRDEGVIPSIVIGIIGSIIGGVISWMTVGSDQAYLAFSWIGLFWSFLGALILVAILNTIQHKSRGHVGV
jgi:uncharacterized membrane protein YeaQ/YmgE (transglycosylase-associated protein family)